MASQTINLHQNFKQVLILCTLFHTHIYYPKIRLWGIVTAISRSFPNVCPGTSFCRFPGNPSRPVVPLKFSKRDKLLTFMDKINFISKY